MQGGSCMHAVIEAKLFDKPGALLDVLEPIAKHNGNIISIAHMRELRAADRVPARIEFETTDKEQFNTIIQAMQKKADITYANVDGKNEVRRKSFAVLLLGHVMDSDANDTIQRISKCGASVSNFYLDIQRLDLPSTAMLWIHIEEKKYDGLMAELDKIAKEKKLMVIIE